jgi:repressor of nif and glnA expression
MRRDKKLAEEILRTLVLDDKWNMTISTLISKIGDKASDPAVRYHVRLLEDIGLVDVSSTGSIRVTSIGQDRAENTDKPDSMSTWAELGT